MSLEDHMSIHKYLRFLGEIMADSKRLCQVKQRTEHCVFDEEARGSVIVSLAVFFISSSSCKSYFVRSFCPYFVMIFIHANVLSFTDRIP